jgi:hypothetical protein
MNTRDLDFHIIGDAERERREASAANRHIPALEQAFWHLNTLMGEYDADSGPPPSELTDAANSLRAVLVALGAEAPRTILLDGLPDDDIPF